MISDYVLLDYVLLDYCTSTSVKRKLIMAFETFAIFSYTEGFCKNNNNLIILNMRY